jgi:hypothetical protein
MTGMHHPQRADLSASSSILPAAPYDDDPAGWTMLPWYDRVSGKPITVTPASPAADPIDFARDVERGSVSIRTLGDVLDAYDHRPEHKSLAPDGTPAGATTVGLLGRRAVRSTPGLTRLSGKEGNRLLERATGVATDPAEYRSDFGDRVDPWQSLVLPVLHAMGAAEVAQRTSSSWRHSIDEYLGGRSRPQLNRMPAIVAAATGWLREHNADIERPALSDPLGMLAALLAAGLPARYCECGCGSELTVRRSRWASDRCRKRAASLKLILAQDTSSRVPGTNLRSRTQS